jgi:hypothetical protein
MVKIKGDSPIVDTPTKGKISRYFQSLGGANTRGAATETAKKFKLRGSGAASAVKKYDAQVASDKARRKSKGNCVQHPRLEDVAMHPGRG